MRLHDTSEGKPGSADISWLHVGAAISSLANTWANREDLIAIVGPTAGRGSPACFLPTRSELEINTTIAFGPLARPAAVGDLREPSQQYEHPRAVGLVAHEAFHARYSTNNATDIMKRLTKEEWEAFELLEESRIEFHGIKAVPAVKEFIRAAVIDINLGCADEGAVTTTDAAFTIYGLLAARAHAGTLTDSEVANTIRKVTDIIGAESTLHLSGIVTQFHNSASVADRELLAKEWVAAKKKVSEERGEDPEQDTGEDAKQLESLMRDVLEGVMMRANAALADQELHEKNQARVEETASAAKEQHKNERASEEVFGTNSQKGSTLTATYLSGARPPTQEERVAAVIIADELERARYHDRIEIEKTSALPPGRLRTRSLIQARAAESKGLRPTIEPWRRTVRKHAIDPTLTVAVMADISGSMRPAMEAMATTAWVLSEAVRRVQGTAAMVYYGNSVFPSLHPGQHLDRVYTYKANDGTEEFDTAFRALDGSLSLLQGSGARLLVIASDGKYRTDQVDRARHWLTQCGLAGVAVLWLPYDMGGSAKNVITPIPNNHISIVHATMSPAGAATTIGRAAATALTRASQ